MRIIRTTYFMENNTPQEEILVQPHIVITPEYHPPTVGASGTFKGKTWRDMPGSDNDNKKMNFALFRRGLFTPDTKPRESARASLFKHFNS